MKRWIVLTCLVLISALGIAAPAAAQASTLATKLTSGKPVKATIAKHGQKVGYTFSAAANKNVTFNITHFSFKNDGSNGEVFMDFYEPGSSSVYTQCNNGIVGNTYCNFTPPVGGTWKISITPFQDTVGSMSLTFANNVPTVALKSAHPVTTTIKYAGQEAGYTFSAKAKSNVTFNVTRFSFSDEGSNGEVFIYFYEPGSNRQYAECNNGVDANTYCNFTAPQAGTWKIMLIPFEASVGSLTLTFATDVPTKALTANHPVTTTIKYAGQHARYTFRARAKKRYTFDVTRFNFRNDGSTGEVFLRFYRPGSNSPYTTCDVASNKTCHVTPRVGGTWSIGLFPFEASVGSLRIKLA